MNISADAALRLYVSGGIQRIANEAFERDVKARIAEIESGATTHIKRDVVMTHWHDGAPTEYVLTCGHVVHGKPRQSHPPAMRCPQCEREASE